MKCVSDSGANEWGICEVYLSYVVCDSIWLRSICIL
ncbi:hypothetical protein F383_37888 [Gossypium arboreum]|uniref:Uncharacterized protein n=1 Tax=Gossypium arboreum TaxID=29729 RepID=A0A0B0ME50_GOSAR|nr:hypothetical protein F383_37888 [Gossypium arboreum]